jgi:hypothetical protein
VCGEVNRVLDEAANGLAEICATITELIAPAAETAKGYRDQMLSEGWSREAAEHMGIEVYQTIMEMVRVGVSGAMRSQPFE